MTINTVKGEEKGEMIEVDTPADLAAEVIVTKEVTLHHITNIMTVVINIGIGVGVEVRVQDLKIKVEKKTDIEKRRKDIEVGVKVEVHLLAVEGVEKKNQNTKEIKGTFIDILTNIRTGQNQDPGQDPGQGPDHHLCPGHDHDRGRLSIIEKTRAVLLVVLIKIDIEIPLEGKVLKVKKLKHVREREVQSLKMRMTICPWRLLQSDLPKK